MGLANDATTAQLSKLMAEAKHYYHLEKRCLGLHGAETLTVLLSSIALWAVVVLIGFLVLLFASLALAFWIGRLTGSLITGVSAVAVLLLLIGLFVYLRRQAWIEEPVARFMARLLVPSDEEEAPPATAQEASGKDTKLPAAVRDAAGKGGGQ